MKASRMLTIFLALFGVVVLAAFLLGGNTLARYHGWTSKPRSPETLSGLLAPHYRVFMPEGEGPWPTALLFSGCDGPKDNMDRWASMLTSAGWGAMIVDSHSPRGFDDAQIWRLICAGQLLTGAERAGDVAVAIEDARGMPQVDPDRIVLVGTSHGGWSILDMLSLRGQDRLPHSLTHWPDSIRTSGLAGVAGVILLYPYCGAGSQVSRHGWGVDIPALFLLVEDDTIVDEEACAAVADRMISQGMDVEIQLLKGTTHGFDQAEKNMLSFLEFSPETTAVAEDRVRMFLDRITGEI